MAIEQHYRPEGRALDPNSAKHVDWATGKTPIEALVRSSRGTELFLAANGPPRIPGQPVVVFEAGVGACSSNWGPVRRLLDPRIRSYCYDRAGYGRALAGELLDVLASAGVHPPYVLVAHSFGAMVAREAVALLGPDDVAGLVLVDGNQEKTHKVLREPLEPLSSVAGPKMLALLDESGLLAGGEHYTANELQRLASDAERESKINTSSTEAAQLEESSESLARKEQLETMALGMQPVTVIRGGTKRDYQRVIAAIQRSELDTEGRQVLEMIHAFVEKELDRVDDDLQREQMRLSANSRFVRAMESGHAVIATEPQLVAGEVSSVWESCLGACSEKKGSKKHR
ncbi:alpha/beta hydrolase- variant 2 [Apiospora arundinis]